MAFSMPQKKQGQQEASFPCSSSPNLQEEGEEPAGSSSSSRQGSSAAMLTPGRQHSRESAQDLVHTQCWGKDLAGLLLPCELCFMSVFLNYGRNISDPYKLSIFTQGY